MPSTPNLSEDEPIDPLAGDFAGTEPLSARIQRLIRSPDGRMPRIIVAERDAAARNRLRRILVPAGCSAEAVGDGAQALAAALRNTPDLVIAGVDLPRMRGLELLRQLRAEPDMRWLPVILLAPESDTATRAAAVEAGADECLPKSVRARELISRVGLHLAMSRVGRESMAAVAASERRLAEVLETIGDAVFAIDAEERILLANGRALAAWEMAEHEVVGRSLIELFPQIEGGAPYRAYREAFRTRRPAHLETLAPVLANRWIGLDIQPAPNGGLVIAFRDIDERKRAEARLRASEQRFRTILEAMPAIAFVIRADGVAEYYNQQFRDYVGEPIRQELDWRTSLQHPDDQEELVAARRRGAAAGIDYTVECRLRRHDGVYRWHRIHNRPIREDGHIVFWLGTAIDIDEMHEANVALEHRVAERTAELEAANRRLAAQIEERERAEARLRQAQRIEAVGQLTSGVAHDFNNLLTAVIGNLELLAVRLGAADERITRLVASAQSAAERGARLTAQLLAFSRQQQLSPEPLDLNRVVGDMGALLHSTIGATVRIDTALSPELWLAFADGSQMELVLLNLAINARDAMPAGGTIRIETRNVCLGPPDRPEHPPEGDYVAVSVVDTGLGIPLDILDRVFDPFFTTKEIGKGSGLGLSQVLGVAQQLGGGVSIDTAAREGTAVTVFLPRAAEPQGAASRQTRQWRPDKDGAPHRGLLLLVDDDNDVRRAAAAMLREAGYEIVEASSAGAALEHLETDGDRIEMMVADIAMPGMSGTELARAVRDGRPDLPVLFITGFAGGAVETEPVSPDRLLRKPFGATELTAKVAALLGEIGAGKSV